MILSFEVIGDMNINNTEGIKKDKALLKISKGLCLNTKCLLLNTMKYSFVSSFEYQQLLL